MFNRKEYMYKWKQNNKEYVKQYNKNYGEKWKKKNREHIREYARTFMKKPEQRERRKKYAREYDRIYHKTRERIRKYKQKVLELLGNKCSKCSYTGIALEIHHIKGNGRKERLEKGSYYLKLINKIKNGSKDYILLCANCHAEEHYKKET